MPSKYERELETLQKYASYTIGPMGEEVTMARLIHIISTLVEQRDKARLELGAAQSAILLNDTVETRNHVNKGLDYLNGKVEG